MLKQSCRRFLHNPNRRRSLLLCCSVAALAIIAPTGNSFVTERQQQTEATRKLAELEDVQDRVLNLRRRLQQSRQKLKSLNERMVGEQHAEALRETITELVRQSGCRLKHITLDDRVTRRWMEHDHPLLDGHQFDDSDEEAFPTEYLLETQRVEVSVSGTYERIFELMSEIEDIDRMVASTFVEVTGDPQRREIDVRWELLLLNLVHSPDEDFYDW